MPFIVFFSLLSLYLPISLSLFYITPCAIPTQNQKKNIYIFLSLLLKIVPTFVYKEVIKKSKSISLLFIFFFVIIKGSIINILCGKCLLVFNCRLLFLALLLFTFFFWRALFSLSLSITRSTLYVFNRSFAVTSP